MKLFNQGSQTFKHDYVDSVTGVLTTYASNPNRYIEVPDDLGERWLKGYPRFFVTDEEAKGRALASRKELSDRDAKIAELESKLARATGFAEEEPKVSGIVSEALAASKRGPGRPAKV